MFTKAVRFMRGKGGKIILINLLVILLELAIVGQVVGWWDVTALAGAAGIPEASYPAPKGGYSCLPTCSETDGKFFLIANDGVKTFAGSKIVLWVGVPGDYKNFELSIFDGDSGKDDDGNVAISAGNWDDTDTEATYTLYADPLKDGSGIQVINSWQGNGSNMPNNAWFTVKMDTTTDALGPSSHYFYRLEVTQPVEDNGGNAFKVRSNGYLSTGRSELVNASIGIVGGLATSKDIPIIYPSFVSLKDVGPSSYTGDWAFSFFVPDDNETLCFWDGDFDRGTSSIASMDTDDPNTSGKPEFASDFAVDERAGLKGAPADDYAALLYRRNPPVKYEIVGPDGGVLFANDEPSGTEEWEKFDISISDDSDADIKTDKFSGGFHVLHIQGLDLHNLVFFRVNFDVCDAEDGCGPQVWTGGHCALPVSYWKRNVNRVLILNKNTNVQETKESLNWALHNTALASKIMRNGINTGAPEAIDAANPLSKEEAEAILKMARGSELMDRTLMQLLTAWLNVTSGKVGPDIKIHMNMNSGEFDGTVMDALHEVEDIILNGGELKRARDLALGINNGGTLTLYEEAALPPALPVVPDYIPADPASCGARENVYNVENPAADPFYGVKYTYQAGTEIKDSEMDLFQYTVPSDTAVTMSTVQIAAQAGDLSGQVALAGCDFTSPLVCGDPVTDDSNTFGFQFFGATDNGDGTITLTYMVQNLSSNPLSAVTIGLPETVVPSTPSGTYTSQVCQ